MSTHSSTFPVKTSNKRWLWLVGVVAFLIALLSPLLIGALFSDLVGGWSINNLMPPASGRKTILWLLLLPFVLSLFAMLLWKQAHRRSKPLTVARGMLTFFLADVLTFAVSFVLITSFVLLAGTVPIGEKILGLLYPGAVPITGEGLGFLWLSLWVVIVVQTLYSFPFLLLAGALIAWWQTHSQTNLS